MDSGGGTMVDGEEPRLRKHEKGSDGIGFARGGKTSFRCLLQQLRKEGDARGGLWLRAVTIGWVDPLDGTNHLFIHLHLPGDHRIWPPENVTISFEPREMNLLNSVLARRTQYTPMIQF